MSVADQRGAPPLRPEIFAISCSFFEIVGKIVGWRPLLRGGLDPPLKVIYASKFSFNIINKTRMHSSRMRTGPLIDRILASATRGGVCSRGGVSGPGGLVPGGVWSRGCPGDGIPACTEADPPPLWTESQTPVKTLPWPNFVAAGNGVRCIQTLRPLRRNTYSGFHRIFEQFGKKYSDLSGADPGFGQGGGPSFRGQKLPTEQSGVVQTKRSICGRGPGPT